MNALRVPVELRPTPLEIVCGLALGIDEGAPRLALRRDLDARTAIDGAVRGALMRSPCLVSFSGGRDSSAVLATATAVARRDGLPLPVPISYRFADAPGSHEQDWQERVVGHLDLPDWERLDMGTELDVVGPVARAVLCRHGPLWPVNAYFHEPLLQRADGGALLTGIGGDELLGPDTWSSARALLSGGRRPRMRDARSVALLLAPPAVRQSRLARRHELRWPWLHPEVDAAINARRADWQARIPRAWHRGVGWWWRSRSRSVLTASMEALAADAGARVVHPFLDPAVAGAVAVRFGARGPADRSAAMRALFSDILPDTVLTRGSKAHFTEAFIAEHTREFVVRWTGTGVDQSLVDIDALGRTWRADRPDPRSMQLLQSAWLHDQGSCTPMARSVEA